jgi:pyruvate/2-oxoglutarate dehydrogenase complex dihydrolipoamide dehydrogenase (E3) component
VSILLVSFDLFQLEHSRLVVAIGATPEVELGKLAGLEIDPNNGGIVTNAYYQATPNVWAVYCCLFYFYFFY